jgi:NAD(P)-dependent dehydrogenase (short-subunit alcohol dehydrogenase family)
LNFLVTGLVGHFGRECAKRLGEGDLLFVGEADLRKDQHATRLEELADFTSHRAAQQLFLGVEDPAADLLLDGLMLQTDLFGNRHDLLSSGLQRRFQIELRAV